MTTITLPRATVEQALHVAESAAYPVALIKALRAALAESERDWSLLKATQASLREHMAEIRRLRAALAQQDEPVQEPEGLDWRYTARIGYVVKPYTAPPQRKLVPLTDEEIDAEWHELDGEASALFKRVIRKFARAVEKASWEKNNGQA